MSRRDDGRRRNGGPRRGAGAKPELEVARARSLGPVRVSEAEREAITAALERAGVTLSDVVRAIPRLEARGVLGGLES